jgi:hypothetical protein
LSKLSIIDVPISKTFGKIQKSIADIFTTSTNQGNHRKRYLCSMFFTQTRYITLSKIENRDCR